MLRLVAFRCLCTNFSFKLDMLLALLNSVLIPVSPTLKVTGLWESWNMHNVLYCKVAGSGPNIQWLIMWGRLLQRNSVSVVNIDHWTFPFLAPPPPLPFVVCLNVLGLFENLVWISIQHLPFGEEGGLFFAWILQSLLIHKFVIDYLEFTALEVCTTCVPVEQYVFLVNDCSWNIWH